MRLVQGREWDEVPERLERLRVDPHWSRVVQTSVDDPVADADQPATREVVLEEVAEILDRTVVPERRSVP